MPSELLLGRRSLPSAVPKWRYGELLAQRALCPPALLFFFFIFFPPGRSLVFDFCGSNSVKFFPKKFSMCFAETFLKKYRLIVIIKFPSE